MLLLSLSTIPWLLLGAVHAQPTTSTAASATVTALDDCHLHDLVQYCMPKPTGEEIAVTTASSTAEATALPESYLDCHSHGSDMYCLDGSGNEYLISVLSPDSHSGKDSYTHDEDDENDDDEGNTEHCHFHAGVEHCTGGASSGARTCKRVDRKYNIPLRIGSIFIVLATSAISVFLPLLLRRLCRIQGNNIVFTIIKQFGTGVILATGFVHLLTHAELMLSNECVGELPYEATTNAIAMGGLLAAFLVEYLGSRIIEHRGRSQLAAPVSEESASSSITSADKAEMNTPHVVAVGTHAHPGDDKLSVLVMECGIIFHSVLIGLTLVVAGDSVFSTLLVVIIFHQGFEGLALGTRISILSPQGQMNKSKVLLASLFSVITPIGMAIGIGARNHFNGNDRETLIALGTLDALSAGILVWVGAVEMLAGDWMSGEMRTAGFGRMLAAGASLLAGLALMGMLGKWA